MNEICSFQLLGAFRIQHGERTITRFRTQKAAAILAYLAYHSGRSHPREALIEMLWPEAEEDSARHSLSLALSSLRSQLEPPGVPAGSVIVADRWSVELNPGAISTDVQRFEQSLRLALQTPEASRRARHLRDALDCCGGLLLPGFYEEWVLAEQQRLAERTLQATRELAALLEKQGEIPLALEYARRAIGQDPLREEAHAEVMRLLLAAGQPTAALRQYRELERVLDQELGERPGTALRQLARQIEEQEARGTAAAPAVTPSAARMSIAPAPQAWPAGTVTFLLTDIEGSTALWERHGEAFRAALAQHHMLLRREFARHGGHEVKEAGDSFVVAFAGAGDALATAVAAQRALWAVDGGWLMVDGSGGADPIHQPSTINQQPALRVRMALHSGDVELEAGEYRGLVLHRAARIVAAASGGQILCSEAAFSLLRRDLETEVRLRDLGLYRLRDVEAPERLFQVEYVGMPQREFPPLRADRAHGGNLPLQFTRFFGREAEIAELQRLLSQGSGFRVQGSGVESWQVPEPSNLLNPEPRTLNPRLVTLTGPGGTGKSRLAIEVANRLVEAFSGAVWFVPLADLTDAQLIPEAILAALCLENAGDTLPLQQVIHALSNRPALLVLDNFEHLVEGGVATVEALLQRLPALTCLVTSRHLLSLPGEQEFPVPPLPIPGGAGSPERMGIFESVRLFVDRAQAVKPDFQVTNNNAPAVAELCNRLEGIPLAIELAAARAQVLTPSQMLVQLADRFGFLVSRKRGVTERQRALRATVDWSFRLLAPELQRFFARLSVLRGAWTAEAAEAVCGGGQGVMEYGSSGVKGDGSFGPSLSSATHYSTSSPNRSSHDVLDDLAQLRECSLVQTDEGAGGIRFRILETLREYGWQQLSAEEQAAAQQRHAGYFLMLAEAAEPELRGEQQAAVLTRLEEEHDNLRAALDFALRVGTTETRRHGEEAKSKENRKTGRDKEACETTIPHSAPSNSVSRVPAIAGDLRGDPPEDPRSPIALRFCNALWYFWSIRGHLAEGRRWLAEVLEMVPAADPVLGKSPLRARALAAAGALAHDQSADVEGCRLLEESVTLWRELDDPAGLAHALNCLANIRLDQEDRDGARRLYEEALHLYRKAGDAWGTSLALSNLGVLHLERSEFDRAAELLEESARLKRQAGNRYGLANTLESLGNLERSRKNRARAIDLAQEALALRREIGHRFGIAMSLNNLGHLLLASGDAAAARPPLLESLALFMELDVPRGLSECLTGLAGVAAAMDRHEQAAQLFGAVAALREGRGLRLTACEQAVEGRWLPAAQKALGERAFAAARETGRALRIDQAVDLARG